MITAGSYLKKKRLEKGLSLLDIEKEIKIRKRQLEAIEKNNWEAFASRVYAEGAVISYAKFLGISKNKILPYFRRDYEKYEEIKFREKIVKDEFSTPAFFSKVLFLVSAIVLFIFLSWQLYLYFKPPSLKVLSPLNSSIKTKKSYYLIKGRVEQDSELKINNSIVLPDNKGAFEYKVNLFKGENKIILQATGPNGRKTVKTIKIFRE